MASSSDSLKSTFIGLLAFTRRPKHVNHIPASVHARSWHESHFSFMWFCSSNWTGPCAIVCFGRQKWINTWVWQPMGISIVCSHWKLPNPVFALEPPLVPLQTWPAVISSHPGYTGPSKNIATACTVLCAMLPRCWQCENWKKYWAHQTKVAW